MNVEVLVATMNQVNYDLIERMNIKTNAIISNQCDKNSISSFTYKGKQIKYLSFAERGVGLNRNNALMRATGDICLIADDDMEYVEDYEQIVIKAFKENPDADVIIFNLYEENTTRYIIKKKRYKINNFNYTKFGAARIAIRRESIIKNGIFFNLCFGGGAKYSAGEDTLFLKDCIQKKMKIIGVQDYIAYLKEDRPSTWFNGYTEKLLMDSGAAYSLLFKRTFNLRAAYFCIKRYKHFKNKYTLLQAYKLLRKGAKEFREFDN